MTPKEPDMRELDELVGGIIHGSIRLKIPCDCTPCENLKQALTSGLLCEPMTLETIKDLIRRHVLIKGDEVWFEQFSYDLHQAQMRRKT